MYLKFTKDFAIFKNHDKLNFILRLTLNILIHHLCKFYYIIMYLVQ